MCAVVIPQGQIALGQARAGAHPRRAGRAGPRQLRPRARHRARARRTPRRRGRELGEPVPHRGSEDGRVRDRRRARRRARRALHPGGQRRQHHRLLARLLRVRRRRHRRRARRACSGWQAAGAAPIVRGEPVLHPETIATAIQIGNPASWHGAIAARDESGGAHRRGHRRADHRGLPHARAPTKACFVEPASAASVAGLLQAAAEGLLERDETSCARSPATG